MEGGQSPKKLLFLQGQSPRQTKKRIPRKPNSKAERAALLHPVRFYLGQRGGAEGGGGEAGGKGVRRARTWVAQSPPAGNWVLLLAAWASRILDSRKRWEAVLVASSAPCVRVLDRLVFPGCPVAESLKLSLYSQKQNAAAIGRAPGGGKADPGTVPTLQQVGCCYLGPKCAHRNTGNIRGVCTKERVQWQKLFETLASRDSLGPRDG